MTSVNNWECDRRKKEEKRMAPSHEQQLATGVQDDWTILERSSALAKQYCLSNYLALGLFSYLFSAGRLGTLLI